MHKEGLSSPTFCQEFRQGLLTLNGFFIIAFEIVVEFKKELKILLKSVTQYTLQFFGK